MRKTSLFIFFLVTTIVAFSQTEKSKLVIFKPEFPDKILASGNELSQFVNHWYKIDASIDELKVESKGKKYFLLAKDTKQSKTILLRLRKSDGQYSAFPIDYIGICNCDHMELDKFTFDKNKVIGCKDCGLSTAGAF